jgi:hypothetical protein
MRDIAMSAQTKRGLMMSSREGTSKPLGRQMPQKRNNYSVSIQETSDQPFNEKPTMHPIVSQVKSSELSVSQGTPTSQVTVVENKRQTLANPVVALKSDRTPDRTNKQSRLMMMSAATNSRPPLMKNQKEVKSENMYL